MRTPRISLGFTLIELLVVIAIIGILSSVVLASLNTARNKGSDASIKASLDSVRAAAEVQYDTIGQKYNSTGAIVGSATCSTLATANTLFQDAGIQKALLAAKTAAGSGDGDCATAADGSAYSIAFPLKTGGAWCIDSTGVSKGTQGSGTTAYTAVSGAATAAHTTAATATTGQTTCN